MKFVMFREVGEVIAGQHIEAAFYDNSGEGVPYLTGPADFGELRPIISKWTKQPKVFAEERDVLVTVKGNGVGKCNLGVNAAIGRQLMAIRPDSKKLDQFYLFHFLRSQSLQVANLGQGATVPGISKSDILDITIPLPSSLSEQKRIAGILDEADGLRRKRQQALALTDQFLRSTFIELFGDPITNPKRWPMVRLGSLGNWASGGTPPRSEKRYFNGDIDWYSAGELNHRFLPPSKEQISQDAIGVSGAKMFKAGTLLVGMYDTAAFKLGILPKAASSNQACANLELLHKSCNLNWLFSNLEFMRAFFLSHRRGVRQKNLTLQMIKDFEMPLPPNELQQKYVVAVGHGESLRQRFLNAESKQIALFNTLVQRAFRSEL